jgi:hypothetical protein
MSESGAPATLQELVSAFETKGPAALGELRERPALVHCAGTVKGESWGFETRAVTAPWDTRVALSMVKNGRLADPELLSKAGAVYAVAKRPGGPFPDRIGVGRTRTADISLRLSSVSKYHAYFTCEEPGHVWKLWDARSRNGTTVGVRRLGSGEGSVVENASSVMFGEDVFLFFTQAGFRKLVESLASTIPGGSR